MLFGIDQIIQLMSQYGYLAIFVLMFLESTIIPIPSEIVLPFAGALIAFGVLKYPLIAFFGAVLASLLGNIVSFYIGFFLGVKVVLRYGRKFGFKMTNYRNAERWIKKYGDMVAFLSKLVPAIRSLGSNICGAFKMDLKRFVVFTFLGVAIWSAGLMYLGFALAGNWYQIVSVIDENVIYVLFASFAVLVLIIRKKLAILFRTAISTINKR